MNREPSAFQDKGIHKVQGHAKLKKSTNAKFDDDGDAIKAINDFTRIDRYLATEPGTPDARRELNRWLEARNVVSRRSRGVPLRTP